MILLPLCWHLGPPSPCHLLCYLAYSAFASAIGMLSPASGLAARGIARMAQMVTAFLQL